MTMTKHDSLILEKEKLEKKVNQLEVENKQYEEMVCSLDSEVTRLYDSAKLVYYYLDELAKQTTPDIEVLKLMLQGILHK